MRQALLLSGMLFVLACFAGCATEDTFQQPPPAPLSGNWINDANGNGLQFQYNNRFVLYIAGDQPQRLTGWAYFPQTDHVSLEFDSRLNQCPGKSGIYMYQRDGDKLTLTVLQDDCAERKDWVSGTWAPKSSGWF
jgi:hypothetical protein